MSGSFIDPARLVNDLLTRSKTAGTESSTVQPTHADGIVLLSAAATPVLVPL